MDAYELAGSLFGTRRMEGSSSMRDYDTTMFGEAVSDSENGTVLVKLSDDVTTPDGSGDAYVELPTYVSVRSGDTVSVGVSTNGTIGDPRVRGVIGGGDRMQAQVDNAEALAEQAEAVVEQVRQDVADFRDDVATTYATKVEREDGDDAVKTWVTTNYTNSNDLATTYATKTLVSQTKDAIELAASQTYETQSDAAATYATKSALTVGLDGIRTEVAEDYQPKGDYATTASMTSAIQQSASSIESSVAATYLKQSDASTTYATKTEVQQTAAGLDTRITTAQSTADGAYLERTATGTTIDTTGAATIRSLVVEGKSVQDGTPSPSAPVPIVSVESRNLIRATAGQSTTNGVMFTPQADGTVLVSGTATAAAFYACTTATLAAGQYAFSGYANGSLVTNQTHYRIYIYVASQSISANSGASFTLTESAAATVYIQAVSGQTFSAETVGIQLERGTTANPYQPYGCVTLVAGSTRTDIDLQGHALRSLPDGTRDEMAVDSLGRVTMTQRVGMFVADSTTPYVATVALNGSTTMRANFRVPDFDGIASNNVVSDLFVRDADHQPAWGNVNLGEVFSTSAGFFFGLPTTVTSESSANAWFASNPTTVLYPLATPQTIDLGTIDLPTPADTLWLDAAIVPTIDATWWTVGGIAGQQALDAEVTERQTLIRQFSGGVLAGYVGNAIAALVNAAGSFDVVRTAWSDGVPSILGTLATFGANLIRIGEETGQNVLITSTGQFFRDGLNNLLSLTKGSTHTETFEIRSDDQNQYTLTNKPMTVDSVTIDNVATDDYLWLNYDMLEGGTGGGTVVLGSETWYDNPGATLSVTYHTSPAMTIYDGLGNLAANIQSYFTATEIGLGGNIYEDMAHKWWQTASVRFFGANGNRGASLEAGYSYNADESNINWDDTLGLGGTISDAEAPTVNGCVSESGVDTHRWLYDDTESSDDYRAESTATLYAHSHGGDAYDGADATARLGVKTATVGDDYARSYVTLGDGTGEDTDIPLQQAIAALTLVHRTTTPTRSLGSGGNARAFRVGDLIVIAGMYSGVQVSSTYTWTNVCVVAKSDLGVSDFIDLASWYDFSGGGPSYTGDVNVGGGILNSGSNLAPRLQVSKATGANRYLRFICVALAID